MITHKGARYEDMGCNFMRGVCLRFGRTIPTFSTIWFSRRSDCVTVIRCSIQRSEGNTWG
jgi:hypothetical protein